jgi:hypothetical protein
VVACLEGQAEVVVRVRDTVEGRGGSWGRGVAEFDGEGGGVEVVVRACSG